jgi:hypothetical protein
MRAAVLISGLVGALAGIAGDQLLHSHEVATPPAQESAARDAAAGRWEQCIARLDAIDARLEKFAVAPAAPTRTDAGDSLAPRFEERLAAIEAAIDRIGAPAAAAAAKWETPPRHAKDVVAVDRLYEAEQAKKLDHRDDHLGYSADRLYDRYGAPDSVEHPANDPLAQWWVYVESQGKRGVYFQLRGGVVEREWAYEQR